ncbi:PDZ domain-containing protein [Cupriavidus basilensis]|uniref:PDZ domain-containing protein n=1 Tax=Cupriavidus basilensis TaxID=68895 RepID=UPI00157A82B2
MKGLPAEKAGIERMDIVLGIGGKELATPEEVVAAIGQLGSGAKVEVQIWHNRSLKSYIVDFSSASPNIAPLTTDQAMEAAAGDFDSGHYFDALKKYQKIVRQNPNDALAWYFIGQTLEKKHESAGAQAA